MKVELKNICEQLTEAINLKKNHQVAACFKEPGSDELVGWIIVKKDKNGTITPISEKYENLKSLLNNYTN